MSSVVVVAVVAGLVTGCATIDYVGQYHEPTTHVDVYFSEADVEREFRVIGQVVATGDQFLSASRLQERMITQATKSGADAVIILSFRRVPLNDEQRVVETIETKDGEENKVRKTTSVQDASVEGNEIRALFIRYRSRETAITH